VILFCPTLRTCRQNRICERALHSMGVTYATSILVFRLLPQHPFEAHASRAFSSAAACRRWAVAGKACSRSARRLQQTAHSTSPPPERYNPNPHIHTADLLQELLLPGGRPHPVIQHTLQQVATWPLRHRHYADDIPRTHRQDVDSLLRVPQLVFAKVLQTDRCKRSRRHSARGGVRRKAQSAGRFPPRAVASFSLPPNGGWIILILNRDPTLENFPWAMAMPRFPQTAFSTRLDTATRSALPILESSFAERAGGRTKSGPLMSRRRAEMLGAVPIRFDPEAHCLLRPTQDPLSTWTATKACLSSAIYGLLVLLHHLVASTAARSAEGVAFVIEKQCGSGQGPQDSALRYAWTPNQPPPAHTLHEAAAAPPSSCRWN